MKKMFKSIVVAALFLIGGTTLSAAELGKEYKLLNPPQPVSGKKIEVLEFFYYGCSHCFDLQKSLHPWLKAMPKDAELINVPVVFTDRDSREPMVRAFYALESMGEVLKLHDKLYLAMNVESVDLKDEAKIADFVAKNGVDRAKFSAAYNSFTIQSKVIRVKQMVRSYRIEGTPTLIVDGKYVITGLYPEDTVRVLNEVIAIARKDRSGKR
jgi:thiol:disulfide interchange protein DsbA